MQVLITIVYIYSFFGLAFAQQENVELVSGGVLHSTSAEQDPIYQTNNSDLFCSPPPLRSECSTYTEIFKNQTKGFSNIGSTNPQNRPCFIRAESVKNASHPGAAVHRYAVYRTPDQNVFEADVPILFNYTNLEGSNKKQDYEDFISRAQACLDSGKPPIIDGGRTLKVNLIPFDAAELKKTNRSVYTKALVDFNIVNLHSSYPRENASNYSVDTSCATISHEVLHLLGLHDEYHENQNTYRPDAAVFQNELGINLPKSVFDAGLIDQPASDCRIVSVAPNLMASRYDFETGHYRVLQCQDQKVYKATQQTVPLNPGSACPKGQKSFFSGEFNNMADVKTAHNRIEQELLALNKTTRDSFVYHQITQDDIPQVSLRPAQFEQILRPNCMSRPEIRTYISGATRAYQNKYSRQSAGRCGQ